MKNFQRAFTLIELLIVVAIIAILAAIAVPNFLEAQVRAKVSRVKNDLRTLATGLEMYQVDHNRVFYDGEPAGRHWGWATVYTRVTTPIAYLTSLFRDPFQDQIMQKFEAEAYPNTTFLVDNKNHCYDYGTAYYHGVYGYAAYSQVNLTSSARWYFRMGNSPWKAGSAGPDCSYDQDAGGYGLGDPYDPTNGTTSKGDIYRSAVVMN